MPHPASSDFRSLDNLLAHRSRYTYDHDLECNAAFFTGMPKGSRPMTTTRKRTEADEIPPHSNVTPQAHIARNAGMPLDMDWVRQARGVRSAVERRAATIPARRTVKKE